MKQFPLTDGVSVVRAADVPEDQTNITEDQLEKVLPRSIDAKNDAVNEMLTEKLSSYLSSRKIEFSVPKTFVEEGNLI